MTHPSSPPAPMTAERLEQLRREWDEPFWKSHQQGRGLELFTHIGALTARIAELERERDEAKARAREPVTERDVEAMRRQLLLVGYEGAAKVLHDLLGRAHAAERELTTLQEITGGILTRAALIARAEALEAELAAARKVEDGDVQDAVDWLRDRAECSSITLDPAPMGPIADLLTRLSAALKEAEARETDAKTLQHQLASDLTVAVARALQTKDTTK